MPLPIALLLPLLRAYWKPVAAGLAVLAASAILVGGCHHYRRVIASNAVLKAQSEAQSQALERWQAAEAERTRRIAEAARVEDAARAELRSLHEAFAKDLTADELAARDDVGRLLGLLSEATAINP